MIDLLKLQASEAERIAYSEGFTMAAELFARIDALEAERDALLEQLDSDSLSEWERKNGPADAYKEFFFDCFEHLAGVYPAPSITNEYDKSVIFNTIAKGAAE